MEPLRLVPARLSGGGRATTPLKDGTRSGTPSRSSGGPRSTSAPKGKAIAQAILETPESSRYLSRRKERIRNNNHVRFTV